MYRASRIEEDNEPTECISCGGKSTDERDFEKRDGEPYCHGCAKQFDEDESAKQTMTLQQALEFLGPRIDDAFDSSDPTDVQVRAAWSVVCERAGSITHEEGLKMLKLPDLA